MSVPKWLELRLQAAAKKEVAVVHEVVHTSPVVVHAQPTRHGKYADAEARKAYRREWMRKKRAKDRDA